MKIDKEKVLDEKRIYRMRHIVHIGRSKMDIEIMYYTIRSQVI